MWLGRKVVKMNKVNLFLIFIVFSFSTSIHAHESCKDDLAIAYNHYEKTIGFIKKNNKKFALYYAKMFQLEAYEFKLMCAKQRLDIEMPFGDIVAEHQKIENYLFNEELIKEKMLSK